MLESSDLLGHPNISLCGCPYSDNTGLAGSLCTPELQYECFKVTGLYEPHPPPPSSPFFFPGSHQLSGSHRREHFHVAPDSGARGGVP